MATSVSLIQALASGLVTSAGVPIASGKVRFYSPGTLTPVVVYSDTAGATPITQPLTLTAGGTGTVYSRSLVRMIVKDSSDSSTLLDVNINSAVSNGVNVDDYGAVGDDATANDAAIAAAVTAAAASPATKVVNFPSGTYRITSAISITSAMTFVGASVNTTQIKQVSTTADGIAVTTAPGFLTIRGILIQAATASTGAAISSTNTNFVVVESCNLGSGFAYGLDSKGVRSLASTYTGSTAGIRFTSGGLTYQIVGGQLGGATYLIDSGANADVYLCGVTSVNANPIRVTTGSVYATGCFLFGALTISNANIGVFLAGTSMNGATTTDSRVGTPVVFSLAGTNSVTPLPAKTDSTKIIQSGGAAVTTINAPTGTFPFGYLHRVVCSNTSGGALTWTWNAVFKISAAVAPATANRITVTFQYDPQDATWSEIARSAAVPN